MMILNFEMGKKVISSLVACLCYFHLPLHSIHRQRDLCKTMENNVVKGLIIKPCKLWYPKELHLNDIWTVHLIHLQKKQIEYNAKIYDLCSTITYRKCNHANKAELSVEWNWEDFGSDFHNFLSHRNFHAHNELNYSFTHRAPND